MFHNNVNYIIKSDTIQLLTHTITCNATVIRIYIQDSSELGLSLASGKYKIKWTKCHDLPVAMWGAYATVIDDVIYIGGGVCPDHTEQYYIFMYHVKENKWTRLSTRLPQSAGVVVNINNKLAVIGGQDSTTTRPTNRVLTLQGNQWTSLYSDMNTARGRPAVASHQQYIIAAGGMNHRKVALDSIEMFDINANQWATSKTCLPRSMWFINATTCGNSIVITGYHDQDGTRSNGVYISTIDNLIDHSTTSSSANDDKWTSLCDTPYWRATIVPQTTLPVILGGEDKQHNATDTIMAYDDSTNSWRTILSLPIKCNHTTIITFSHSIIMAGGCTSNRTVPIANNTSLTSVMIGELVPRESV